jgi:hypothetical protein
MLLITSLAAGRANAPAPLVETKHALEFGFVHED